MAAFTRGFPILTRYRSRSAVFSTPNTHKVSIVQQTRYFLLPPDARASTKKARHLRRRGHDLSVKEVTLQFLRNVFLNDHFWSRYVIFSPPIYNRISIVQQNKASSYVKMCEPQREMRDICFIEQARYIIVNEVTWQFCEKL